MRPPILCYVTDRRSLDLPAGANREAALITQILVAASAGVDWIQIREKDLDGGPLFDVASAVGALRGSKTKLLINDRLDAAWAAQAGGVHLGEGSLPVADVVRVKRRSAAGEFLVGASCHSLEAAARAAGEGADYIFFGPVFATPSKAAFGAPQGLALLAAVCRAVSAPVLAIGGITAQNAKSCLESGAAGIAAIRLFQQAANLAALVRELR